MTVKIIPTSLLALGLTTTPLALADHNSPWGEGWANMPNEIHNTRVETRDSDDPSAFIDFVRQGGGIDVDSGSAGIGGSGVAGGMGRGNGGGGRK